jgi:hypothetical protein
MPELSEAGRRFGEAFCLSEERMTVPFSELTPEEQSCITRVGESWQKRIQERLGGGDMGTADVVLKVMQGEHQVGTLTLMDGQVTLCLPQIRCEEIGHGMDGLGAADKTLRALGFGTELLSGSVPGSGEEA